MTVIPSFAETKLADFIYAFEPNLISANDKDAPSA